MKKNLGYVGSDEFGKKADVTVDSKVLNTKSNTALVCIETIGSVPAVAIGLFGLKNIGYTVKNWKTSSVKEKIFGIGTGVLCIGGELAISFGLGALDAYRIREAYFKGAEDSQIAEYDALVEIGCIKENPFSEGF